ncbi:MAG: hypothetical protein HY785_28950 [Oscillatoriophycideae cyanobacterium NC_groundwater_1537_Pr4_S-0.65um_50_18]|nr:hypothetical protein [Oscillatoriophycideae cyanobacterium NC_groundwater_1537_Pr4_S-0.65um_50_18]
MGNRTRFTHPLLRRDSWTLWEWWVLATIAGEIIGIGIIAATSAIASHLTAINTVTLLHIVGALEGTVLGLMQWLVLRRYVKHAGWWVLATMIGAIAAWLMSLQVTIVLILIFSNNVSFVTTSAALLKAVFWLGAWVGAVLGFAQWLVLRTHVRYGALWIVANAFAWGVGLLVAWAGAMLVTPGEFRFETALVGITVGATIGVVVGSITGIVLVGLLKPRLLRHREASKGDRPHQ